MSSSVDSRAQADLLIEESPRVREEQLIKAKTTARVRGLSRDPARALRPLSPARSCSICTATQVRRCVGQMGATTRMFMIFDRASRKW